MYNAQAFGRNLQEHLSSHGIEQKWVAEKMGTSQATLSRYVTGARLPGVESLVELAQVLGVSVDYLLGIEQPASKAKLSTELTILTQCYSQTPLSIRKIIWASLDPYMTPEQRLVIEASMSTEGKSNVG